MVLVALEGVTAQPLEPGHRPVQQPAIAQDPFQEQRVSSIDQRDIDFAAGP